MTMGSLNTAPTFLAMITKLQMEWDTLAKERVLKNDALKSLLMMCYFIDAHQRTY